MAAQGSPTPSRNAGGPNTASLLGSRVAQHVLGGSHSGLVDSTPGKNQEREDIAPTEDKDQKKRRERLLRQFTDNPEPWKFDDFIGEIGVLGVYNKYTTSAQNLFKDLAQAAPALVMKQLLPVKGQENNEIATALIDTTKRNEAALMSYFIALCRSMSERAAEANDATASADVTIPQELYDLIDCQNAPVPGSSHKPDGVFHYSEPTGGGIPSVHMCVEAKIASNPGTIPSDNLGQILDYINAIWTEQPTRVIVPILYIHGKTLTLFVFTRGPWYRVELGNICYPSITPSLSATNAAHKCLQRLWFILTLPADRFGHFCNIDKGTENIQFSRVYGGISKVANASLTSSIDSDVLSLRKRIPRPVNPRSRVAYLFDTTYNSKRAVLKLSWTPIKRLPESAVYDILHKANVEGVPVVYDSGLLKTDAFGYRLEYIILEHCGQSIERYVSECRERNTPDSEIGRHVELYIRQVSTCLVQARAYGILHRDISDGNIAVRDGQAKVIDWGYSKIIETDPAAGTRGIDPAIVDEVSKQWGFDKDAVLKNETTWDPLTGTVMFMSIPVLFGRLKRGLFDDIESLFYVVIRAFSDSKECMGFKFHDSKTFAVTRVGFLGCAEDYLEFFGISKDLGELKQTIDAMSKYLFYAGDRYIGHKLISNAEYERVPDLSLAVRFMDEEAVGMLRRFLPDDPVEEARSSTKRMRISNTPGADEAAGALPVPAKRPRGRPPKRGRGRGKV